MEASTPLPTPVQDILIAQSLPNTLMILIVVLLAIIALASIVIAITLMVKKFGAASAPQQQTHVPQSGACPKCGHPISPGQAHCGYCGIKL